MSMGFQSFIEGTSFDVLNAMSYNFVVDFKNVSGNGSSTYNFPGFTLSAVLTNTTFVGNADNNYSVSVSGQTVRWSSPRTSRLIVTATPSGAGINDFGFTLYDYDAGYRRFKIAPSFTPYNLVQVIDITPSYNQVCQTRLPASQPMIAFHRSTISSLDHVMYSEITQNGYWAFRFRGNTGLNAMTPCRIYIFSKLMINAPTHGFFLYENGVMVWHSNCLPLNLKLVPNGYVSSNVPVAVSSGLTGVKFIPRDPTFPGWGTQVFELSGAGIENGKYVVSLADRYQEIQVNGQGAPPSFSVATMPYIETNVYDAYFKQALGV